VLLASTWPPTVVAGALIKVKVVQERVSLVPIRFLAGFPRRFLIGRGPPDPGAEAPGEGALWWAAWGFDRFSDLVYYGFPAYAQATTESIFSSNRRPVRADLGGHALLLPLFPRLPVEKGRFGDLYDRTAEKMRQWRDAKDGTLEGVFFLSRYWSMYRSNTEYILEELFTGKDRGAPPRPPGPDQAAVQRAETASRAFETARRRERAAQGPFLSAAAGLAASGSIQRAEGAGEAADDLDAAVRRARDATARYDAAESAWAGSRDAFRSNPSESGTGPLARASGNVQSGRGDANAALDAVESRAWRLISDVSSGELEEPPIPPSRSFEAATERYEAAEQEWNEARAEADRALAELDSATDAIQSGQGRGSSAPPFRPGEGEQFLGRRFPRPYMLVKEWERYYYFGVGRESRRRSWLPGALPNRSFPGFASLGNMAYASIELANATATDTFTPDWYAKLTRANPGLMSGVFSDARGSGDGGGILGDLKDATWFLTIH
jgi:hypothetical protein